MQDERPNMLDGERSDAYTRRTGFYPPHWDSDRCKVQDARISEAERADNAAYLRRWSC